MALKIASPNAVAKVDQLAKESHGAGDTGRLAALLAQLDRLPDREDAVDPLRWDANGLPT